MNFEEALSDVLERDEQETPLSRSEKVYLDYRQTVESGLFNTGFDLLPAKSRTYGYTDQTLRSHLLNGAAFAARLNHALREIDDPEALSNVDLRRAIALFTVHDLHKSEEAQRRRSTTLDRRDADKDIQWSELNEYVSELNLRQFQSDLDETDYMAAALGTEVSSGRHRGATSRTYARLRPWLRIMDAAASTDSPTDVSGIEQRLSAISDDVRLTHHRLNDTKGLTTNFLTSAISTYVSENTSAVPLVYFVDGALYLKPAGSDPLDVIRENEIAADITRQFLETVQQNVSESSQVSDIQKTLTDKLNYGFMEFSRPTYLLYGLERADVALREDLTDRMSGEPKLYAQYKLGLIAASAAGVIDELPSDWRTGQAATVYIATLFSELFDPLSGGEKKEAVEVMAEALEVPEVSEFIHHLDDWEYNGDLTEERIEDVATHLDIPASDVKDALDGGIHLRRVKRFAAVLAAGYIDSGADGSLSGLSSQGVLKYISERLLSTFWDWRESWDSHRGRGWDADQASETKADAFLDNKIETVRHAIYEYITDTVVLFGGSIGDSQSSKTKLDQYSSQYQPHICLLCNSVLTGSRSKADFETSEDTIGLSMRFSHLNEISAEGGEPDALACPLCELEMVIRSSVHSFTDDDSEYLFLAPDYFYAPADIQFQRTVRDYLFASDGYNLLQVAQKLVDSRPDARADAAADVLSVLSAEEDDESYQNTIKSYDGAFTDTGSLGVFRLDPPRRDVTSRDSVTRVPRQVLALATGTVFSWLTSSRVLLTSRPVPATNFDEYDEMVRAVDLSAEVQAQLGDTATIAYLSDIGRETAELSIKCFTSNRATSEAARVDEQADGPPGDDVTSGGTIVADPTEGSTGENSSQMYSVSPSTELEEWIYRLAGLLTVTFRAHGTEVQRLKSTMSAMQDPFPGATAILKGDETNNDYGSLNAANLLDTLTHPSMSNSIERLAEAGFETVRPNLDKNSNYNYERLFRVARDAVSDNMMKNADQSELETMVAGQVMKAAARAEDSQKFAKEHIKRESAEEFAEIFVNDILYGICDGDFYQLRRHENTLAAGYNAAIRRQEAESFAQDTN